MFRCTRSRGEGLDPKVQRAPVRDRGVVMVESVFIFMMLLFLLLVYQALEKQWLYEITARSKAHDRTFWKAAATPIAIPQVGLPSLLTGHTNLSVQGIPSLSPTPPSWLDGYKQFHTKPVEGWKTAEVTYGSGWDLYRGTYKMHRYGGATRPSWTWLGFPFVYTQDMMERGKVKDWYEKAYDHLLPDSSVDGLGLDKAPL